MEATASAKYLRGSAQKARLVVDMIRGKDVNRALAILRFSKKRAAAHIEKCMRSAIANANEIAEKANISIDPDDLWVRTAFVDRGPTKNRRRVRPAPQGRAYREQRHYCHITIQVTSEEQAKTEKELKAEAGRAKKAPAKKAAPKKAKAEEVETPKPVEAAEAVEAASEAKVADAKNVDTQTTAA